MEKVLVIIGPTAVGKTNLSIFLAKQLNGEVINGDSVQVYKGLDIGSAKINDEEKQGVAHHLLNIKNPDEEFSVAEFQNLVRSKITEIQQKGKLPIICGGTGLYIQAVLYDYQFEEDGRNVDFNKKYVHYTNEELHLRLSQVDETSSQNIHYNNRRRVLRALEIYENSQKTKDELIKSQSTELLYDAFIIGLNMDRKVLYERINKRVDLMIEAGLLNEVTTLHDLGYPLKAIGYREFNDYFLNNKSLDEVIKSIKQNTRHYAKRQLTYFRNKLPVNWFENDLLNTKHLEVHILNSVNKWLVE